MSNDQIRGVRCLAGSGEPPARAFLYCSIYELREDNVWHFVESLERFGDEIRPCTDATGLRFIAGIRDGDLATEAHLASVSKILLEALEALESKE